MKLKDECGVWIDDYSVIAGKFIADFNQCFRTTHGSARVVPHLCCLKRFLLTIIRNLLSPPHLEEVKNALFSINSDKTPGPNGFKAGFSKNY